MSSQVSRPKLSVGGITWGPDADLLGFSLEQLAVNYLAKEIVTRSYGLPHIGYLLDEKVDGRLYGTYGEEPLVAKVYRRFYDRGRLAWVTYGVPLSLMNLPLQPRAEAYAELIRVATRSLADFMSKKESAFQAEEFLEDIEAMLKEYLSLVRPLPPSENIARHLQALRKVGILG